MTHRSGKYFIDNSDETVFAILKYNYLDVIQKFYKTIQSNLFIQEHLERGLISADQVNLKLNKAQKQLNDSLGRWRFGEGPVRS